MTSSTGGARRNRLADETSPYLLQHADNPVDWLPWGEEALALARSTGKPILLSIGYSACHWCHVMAHESFEDEATAAVMNRHFVNIKVDREERPDLDRIYQLAHQLLTQRPGGWPLTMFLTPDDHTPFFGGTYFPPAPRYGMPAFKDLLLRIVDFLASHSGEIARQRTALRDALARAEAAAGTAPGSLTGAPLAAAREQLERTFDATHGGFGPAPKFPHPTGIDRLMRHHVASVLRGDPDLGALHIVRHSLEHMARGGVFDQVGGGFFRYAVDEAWMIPHFEKMLYDNAALLGTYVSAAGLTGEPLFAEVAHRIGEWVMREMQSPEGGYFSSLDADSDAEEGKFYLWSADEVRAVLNADEQAVVSAVFGLDRPPNFEGRLWHLHTFELPSRVARRQGRDEAATAALLASSMAKLLAARAPRRHPGRDEKVLGSWNALMISAMVQAARRLDRQDFAASADRARDFVHACLWRDGRLLATSKDGRARLMAYLDDYAFLLEALLNLLSVRWRREDLDWCIALADVLLERFEDRDAGGFYFTANDHERLIHRSKSFMDDALPSGNAIACASLLRLGHLLGEMRYLDAAERALECAWPALNQAPHAHNAMLNALEDHLSPPQGVVIRGSGDAARRWLARAGQGAAPRRHALLIPSEAGSLPGLLAARRPTGEVTAYVCTGQRCDAPAHGFETYAASLAREELPTP